MSTSIILLLMAVGLALGWFLFSGGKLHRLFKGIGRLQSIATMALLFAMGLWLGGNDSFWQNLGLFGLQSAAYAIAAVAGSVALAYLVGRFCFGGKKPWFYRSPASCWARWPRGG